MNTFDLNEIKSKIKSLSLLDEAEGFLENDSYPMAKSSKKDIERLELAIGGTLPETFKDFFHKIGAFTILWRYRHPDNSNIRIFGDCTLYEIAYMLKNPDPNVNLNKSPKYEHLLWNEGDDESIIMKLQSLYILDRLSFDNYVLFGFSKDYAIVEIFLYTRPNSLSKMTLSFEEYIQNQLKYNGIYLWQQYFLEDLQICPLIPDNFFKNISLAFPKIGISQVPDQAGRQAYDLTIQIEESKKDYLNRFQNTIQKLEENNKIVNLETTLNVSSPGTHPADFYRAYLALGHAVPTDVVAFFQEVNNVSFSWHSALGDGLEAEFVIPVFEELFVEDDGKYTWVNRRKWDYTAAQYFEKFGHLTSEELEVYKEYRILYREERNVTLIKMNKDGTTELALAIDYDFYKLQLTFEDFIEALLEFRGVKNWQYLFVEKEQKGNTGIEAVYLDKVFELFPDIDLRKFDQYLI